VPGLGQIARWIVWAQAVNAVILLCVTRADYGLAPHWIFEVARPGLNLMGLSVPITPVGIILLAAFAGIPRRQKFYLRLASIALSLASLWIMLPLVQ
jgi:hypothetical protein